MVGKEITESLLAEYQRSYVKYTLEVDTQLSSLSTLLWAMMGQVATFALELHPLVQKYDLKTPGHKFIRHLIKAIFLVCTEQSGVPEARAAVQSLRALVNSKQKPGDSLDTFFSMVKSRNIAADSHGVQLTEQQLVVVSMDGLLPEYSYHTSTLNQALHVTGGSLPRDLADLRSTLQKIDNTRPSGVVSAFSANLNKRGKPQGKDEGKSTIEAKDKYIEVLKAERDKLKTQLQASTTSGMRTRG